jgi:hypothetical protein
MPTGVTGGLLSHLTMTKLAFPFSLKALYATNPSLSIAATSLIRCRSASNSLIM